MAYLGKILPHLTQDSLLWSPLLRKVMAIEEKIRQLEMKIDYLLQLVEVLAAKQAALPSRLKETTKDYHYYDWMKENGTATT